MTTKDIDLFQKQIRIQGRLNVAELVVGVALIVAVAINLMAL